MLDDPTLAYQSKRLETDGYTIVDDAIDADLVAELAAKLRDLETFFAVEPARNSFEGAQTLRVYNLLALGRVWERVPVHANVLPLIEQVLDPGCLISSLSSITILPGEIAQPIHADDQLLPIPKPHVPTVCNSMWALTDFTAANGATRLVPPRVGIAMNYCAGFIRQQENQQLGIPRDIAAHFGPRLRELVGYSVYNALVGHINKHSPVEILDAVAPAAASDSSLSMVWDPPTS